METSPVQHSEHTGDEKEEGICINYTPEGTDRLPLHRPGCAQRLKSTIKFAGRLLLFKLPLLTPR
jgi:hypothetical protein